MQNKIKSFDEIQTILERKKTEGLRIVHCHGVFDLLHPGHIRHFKSAKAQGDILVVTVTPDRFVNKGPGRPVFTEVLRLESLASLQDIDYVVLNDSPDAVSAIKRVRPSYYAKGDEYKNHSADITGKISEEALAVAQAGGEIFYTDDIVFSSSSLLNKYFDQIPAEVTEFLNVLKKDHSSDDILEKIEALSDLKVLVIGDAIIDEYQFTTPLGQSGKGLHMVAKCLENEVFLGGTLIIANHISNFVKDVTLLTTLGRDCPHLGFVKQHLSSNITPYFNYEEDSRTLLKKRYVLKDGATLTKLFETYSGFEKMSNNHSKNVIDYLRKYGKDFDLILCADFGNGFTNPHLIEEISDVPTFLALNSQTNSGNRGYNVITNYRRADYISVNEPEIRLSTHDKISSLNGLATDICQIMNASHLSITQGVNGVYCYDANGDFIKIPAFSTSSVDRIGAGDSYLSLSSLCFAKGYSPIISGFLGSLAAAMSVQVVGNQESVTKVPLSKFIRRIMK